MKQVYRKFYIRNFSCRYCNFMGGEERFLYVKAEIILAALFTGNMLMWDKPKMFFCSP